MSNESELRSYLEPIVLRGDLVLVVGSMVSVRSGAPSWSELVGDLRVRAGAEVSEAELIHNYDRAAIAERLHEKIASRILRRSDLYAVLADLPVPLVLTTNLDDLLERQLTDSGRTVQSVLTAWELERPHRGYRRADLQVVKLFGDVATPESVVLSLADLARFEESRHLLMLSLERYLAGKTLVFVGFSPESEELRVLVELLDRKINLDATRRALIAEREPSESVSAFFDATLHVSLSAVAPMLRSLLADARPPVWPGLASERQGRLYRYFLYRSLRFMRTVDQHRVLDLDHVDFELEVEDGFALDQSAGGEPRSPDSPLTKQRCAHSSELMSLLDSSRWLVVVGDPGAGKTCLLRSLACTLARRPDSRSPFPVFMDAHDLQFVDDPGLFTISDWLESSSGLPGLARELRELLASRRCVVIVDGLDELSEKRRAQVNDALEAISSQFPHSHVVVSTRDVPHASRMGLRTGLVLRVAPLSDDRIEGVIRSWHGGTEASSALIRALKGNPYLRSLASRPLFLSLVSHVWESQEVPRPTTVMSLFKAATDLLLGRWAVERSMYQGSHFSREEKDRALQLVAVYLRVRERSSVDLEEIAPELQDEIGVADGAMLLLEVASTTGVLVRRAKSHWAFAHSAFSAFYCARSLESCTSDEAGRMISHPAVSAWRDPLEFWISSLSESQARTKLEELSRYAGGLNDQREELDRSTRSLRALAAVIGGAPMVDNASVPQDTQKTLLAT